MKTKQYTVLFCDFLNPINDNECEYVREGAIVWTDAPKHQILVASKRDKVLSWLEKEQKKHRGLQIQEIDRSGYTAMPGFFDTHFHWVQDDVRLKPKANLLTWLAKYTWPYEKKFANKEYSQKRAHKFAQELLACGTLGGMVYSSIHGHTVDHGLKNFVGHFCVGNVLMTMNSPDYLIQTKTNAISLVNKYSKKFKEKYAMTPRFAPTTHPEVMKEGAKIAKKNKSFIQTHLSETENECDYVLGLYKEHKGFENIESYTHIYKKCGVLGPKTIMGHGIYLSDKELKLLSKSKTSVAHCPTSNAPVKNKGLGSGLFDFKKANKFKVNWSLASDIGGGPFLSMFDVMNSFVEQNKKKKISGVTYVMALYRATLAGAKLMHLDKVTGNFAKAKEANLFLVKSPRNCRNSQEAIARISNRKGRSKQDELVSECYFQGKQVFLRS
ncbi:MAG: amidohydrolase family protein [Oligoflexia bacterium]|nr:amidohydrolase family protein [Oligoflexia bacterium]